jgi:site-specific recombinase XerD
VLEKKRSKVINEDLGIAAKVRNSKIEEFSVMYLQRRRHIRFHKRDALSVKTLLKYFHGKNLMSIIPGDIEDYIGKRMRDGVSNSTINRELTCLKRMFSLAIKWGDARKNPVKDVDFLEEPPGRTRFLSEEESQYLIYIASDHINRLL